MEKASAVPDIYVHSLDVGGDYAGYTLPGKKILKTLFRKGKDKLECKGRPFPSNDLKTEVSQICPEGILCRRGILEKVFVDIAVYFKSIVSSNFSLYKRKCIESGFQKKMLHEIFCF